MKKTILALALATVFAGVSAQEQIIPTGKVKADRPLFRIDATQKHGKMSFVKDGDRNAVKVEVVKFATDKEGQIFIQTPVYVGGSSEFPQNGFTVKPNTKYQFSYEIKGTGKRVFVSAHELTTSSFWKGRNRLKIQGKAVLPLKQEWEKQTLTFTTGANAKRVVLQVNFYGHEKDGSVPEKPGDYFMLSNVTFQEAAK